MHPEGLYVHAATAEDTTAPALEVMTTFSANVSLQRQGPTLTWIMLALLEAWSMVARIPPKFTLVMLSA